MAEILFIFLGVIALVMGFLLPKREKDQKLINMFYGLSIVVIAYAILPYQQKIGRVAEVEKVAMKMLADQNTKYTQLGFVHAALVFLEKNQDLYPDSYKRAVRMCVQFQCDTPRSDDKAMQNLSLAMGGLLTGLATINDG